MSTRVFVRLYDGDTQNETEDEVLELPLPPLKWKDAITAMVAAVGKQVEYDDGVTTPKARLFLLPTEATGITAELNARSVRFGVRENDRFVLCLRGEDYQQPSERQASAELKITDSAFGISSARPMTLSTPNSSGGATEPSISPYANVQSGSQFNDDTAVSGNTGDLLRCKVGSVAPSGGVVCVEKKGNKRYRSMSGKMAAIKALGEKGLISNDDRNHLKALLLNSDSPQLQEALDKYNNTGDFQAVKDLLLKEIQNPSSKRNTSDWLSESFVNDIALNIETTPPTTKTDPMPEQKINNSDRFNSSQPAKMAPSETSYGYQITAHSTPLNSASYPQCSSMAFNQYGSTSGSLVTHTGNNLSKANGYFTAIPVCNGYQPTTVISQLHHHQQASPTNSFYGIGPPHINLPLRDRATYINRGYESSPIHSTIGMTPSEISAETGTSGYGMQQRYAVSQGLYPASVIYAGDQSQYSLNSYMNGANGAYSPYQQPQYAMNRFGFGSMQSDMGYNFYATGYGFGKAQLRAGPGGKWTTAPPMPSYPPPCSKEEKKEKIAKWLKKRENRNWSNKPSYPVRHSIAKNRKRGEDGRFITKARLAEMEAEEAAMTGNSAPYETSVLSSRNEQVHASNMSRSSVPQSTPVP
ncbi:hypothetical protein PsorP6_008595 [Peronosclerospora sorghi]|uniref:Uncharacterized protein n=1 Tax=Peronosclerospora sorghi TaxID=230839 RepID=A0ACC0W848_9STRA|nr:hypothetical protein PsorP6_008595 [Peronosclerospora sorghi]